MKNVTRLFSVILAGIMLMCVFTGCAVVKRETDGATTDTAPVTGPVVDPTIKDEEPASGKLDDSKPWVYDADYTPGFDATEYTDFNGDVHYLNEIIYPYINMDSADASVANEEIRGLFDKDTAKFKAITETEDKFEYVTCGYTFSEANEILSVLIARKEGGTDVPTETYDSFCLSTQSFKRLSYEEVYTACGFTAETVDTAVKAAITAYMDQISENAWSVDATKEDFLRQSIDNYESSLADGTLRYCISEGGTLEVVVTTVVPAGRMYFDELLEIH